MDVRNMAKNRQRAGLKKLMMHPATEQAAVCSKVMKLDK
jgi:hypothetical protein